jgi:hypothetical protein
VNENPVVSEWLESDDNPQKDAVRAWCELEDGQ